MEKVSTTKKKIYFLLGIALIFIIWETLYLIINDDLIVPSIGQTFAALWKLLLEGRTYRIILHTFLRLLLVLSICFVTAIILGVLSYKYERVRYLLSPMMSLFKMLPVASIIILLLIIAGQEKSPYYIAGLIILPILYEGIYGGLKNISSDVTDDIKTMTNLNFRVAKDIYIPLAMPFIKTALLQSVGLGFKVMVMAEYIAQPANSIGAELKDFKNYLQYDGVFAWTIILLFLVIIVELVLKKLKAKV